MNCFNLLNTEKGTIRKKNFAFKACLIYPNTYKTAMSNLAVHTLYRILNSRTEIYCERSFYEPFLRGISFEEQSPLKQFDILAFSVSFEPDILNAIKILKDSSIPIGNRERQKPFVIFGGVASSLCYRFLEGIADAIVFGDGEDVINEIANVFLSFSKKGTFKNKITNELSKLKGVYCPSFSKTLPERRQADLSACDTMTSIITPHTTFSNTFLIETSRGCAYKCRFCVAGHCLGPYRLHPKHNILHSIEQGLRETKKIGLVGSSIANYPDIEQICEKILVSGGSVSVSSIRADTASDELIKILSKSQKTFTLAPEAGNERLRDYIGKPIKDVKIFQVCQAVHAYCIKSIKLYFMIGLPSETQDDIMSIVDLVKKISNIVPVNVSVSIFVPKPGTAFENEKIISEKDAVQKIDFLKSRFKNTKNIRFSFESPRIAMLQYNLLKGNVTIKETE
jgi:radical SAM superfamily enzyme YgiQ (UPF0313 family)